MYIIHELKNSHDKISDRVLQQECNVVLSQRFVMLLRMKLSAKEIPRMQPPLHVKAIDRKSTRLNSSHLTASRMPSSA